MLVDLLKKQPSREFEQMEMLGLFGSVHPGISNSSQIPSPSVSITQLPAIEINRLNNQFGIGTKTISAIAVLIVICD